MSQISLIALDLDGTLLNSEKKISPRNRAALAAAQAQGVKVVLTTGRPLKAMDFLLEELTDAELVEQQIYQNTIRLSIGTEHIDDILADLEAGFAAVRGK